MGNAGIIYDGQTIDLGSKGVHNAQPGRAADLHRSFGGTGQTVVEHTYELLKIEKDWRGTDEPLGDVDLYRALMTFWNAWAVHGRPFAFAFDLSKTFDSVLTADPVLGNRLVNGDVEAWTSATQPEDVTVALSGSTTFTREVKREDVYEGLYSARWDIVGGAQSTAAWLTDKAIPSGAAFGVLLRQRFSASGQRFEYAIQNQANSKWAQNTTPTWSAGQVWLTAGAGVTGFDWALHSQTFASGPDASGILKIVVRNPTSPASAWLDALELRRTSGTLAIRNRTGLAASDAIRLISRTESREEIVVVGGLTTPADLSSDLTLAALPRGRFDVRDIVRAIEYYPYLIADQDEPAVMEVEPGGLFRLSLKCRDALTGRT